LWRINGADVFLSGPLLSLLSIEKGDRALGEDGTNDGHDYDLHTIASTNKKIVSTLSGRYDEATFQKRAAMTEVAHSKSERIDVRASAPVKQLLQEAARVAHKNVSEFLLDAGIIAANQTLADRSRFELSDEQWLAFQAALDQPVNAKPRLKKLLSEPGLLG
jgi:uncharacterized protein (DUF1778 family)